MLFQGNSDITPSLSGATEGHQLKTANSSGGTRQWLNGSDFAPTEDKRLVYAILKAIIAHLHLSWIHPFGDGNGRVARLLEFQILIGAGVPAASAHLLSNHYNLTRSEYYRQLDRASATGGNVVPFVSYAVRGFLDGLKQQIDVIWTRTVGRRMAELRARILPNQNISEPGTEAAPCARSFPANRIYVYS